MQYEIAVKLARDIASDLAPVCERIEIAGGLRRRKADVHDLAMPDPVDRVPAWPSNGKDSQ